MLTEATEFQNSLTASQSSTRKEQSVDFFTALYMFCASGDGFMCKRNNVQKFPAKSTKFHSSRKSDQIVLLIVFTRPRVCSVHVTHSEQADWKVNSAVKILIGYLFLSVRYNPIFYFQGILSMSEREYRNGTS